MLALSLFTHGLCLHLCLCLCLHCTRKPALSINQVLIIFYCFSSGYGSVHFLLPYCLSLSQIVQLTFLAIDSLFFPVALTLFLCSSSGVYVYFCSEISWTVGNVQNPEVPAQIGTEPQVRLLCHPEQPTTHFVITIV